jgi:hypothetical protein
VGSSNESHLGRRDILDDLPEMPISLRQWENELGNEPATSNLSLEMSMQL